MSNEIPIVCTLTDRELQARRKKYFDKFAALLIDSTESENGLIFRFPLETSVLRDLTEIIDLESRCCPFLDFKLELKSGNDFVSVELSGADGAKETIRSLFRLN